MKTNIAKAQVLETQVNERQSLQTQQRATMATAGRLNAAGLNDKNGEMVAGIDQDIANRKAIQSSLDESRVPLDIARKWEAAISQRLDNLQKLNESAQKDYLDPAWARYKAKAADTGSLQGVADWALQTAGGPGNYPGVYAGEDQPTLELSHKRITEVQTQNNNLRSEIINRRELLLRSGKDDRKGFTEIINTDYRKVLSHPEGTSELAEAGETKGDLEAAYNETASLSKYESVMNGDAQAAKSELAKVTKTSSELAGNSNQVAPNPAPSSGGGALSGGAAPQAPSAAPPSRRSI